MPTALVVGLITSVWVPPSLTAMGVVCPAAVVAATRFGPAATRVMVIAVVIALAGWAWGAARIEATATPPMVLPARAAGVVSIDDAPRRGRFGGWSARARVERVVVPGARLPSGTRLLADGNGSPPRRGDLLRFDTGQLRSAITPDSPPWWRDYLERQRVAARIRLDGAQVVGTRGGLTGVRDRLSTWVQSHAAGGLEGDRAGLIRGMAFGGTDGLRDDTDEDFRTTGLAHLVAVSGQNIAVVATAVIALMRAVGARRRGALVAAAICIVVYCAVCEGGASVGRAAVAGILGVVAELRSSPRERWYLLLTGLAILLCIQPRAIGDPGLQLSFSAVAGLFVFSGTFSRYAEGWVGTRLASLAGLAAAASLSTAPVLVWNFGTLSIVGLVVNIVAVPLAAPIVVLALVGVVLGAVVPPIGLLATAIAGLGAQVLLVIAHAGAALPGAAVSLPSEAALPLGLVVLGIAAAIHWPAARRQVGRH